MGKENRTFEPRRGLLKEEEWKERNNRKYRHVTKTSPQVWKKKKRNGRGTICLLKVPFRTWNVPRGREGGKKKIQQLTGKRELRRKRAQNA